MGGIGSGRKSIFGRKTAEEELDKLKVIRKAWHKTSYKLGMSDPQSYAIAKDIVVKDMVNKSDVQMEAQISEKSKGILDKYISSNRIPEETTN